MNILFINYTYPNPELGGTSRSIINISKYLNNYGYSTYIAFFSGDAMDNIIVNGYVKISNTNKTQQNFKDFLFENKISIVINFVWGLDKSILKIIKLSDCFFINSLRFDPLYFYKITDNLIKNKKYYFEAKYKLRRFLSFFYRFGAIKISNNQKRELFKNSDRFIVLSDEYKDNLIKLFSLNNLESKKIYSIHNTLSYSNLENTFLHEKKEKRVLIVSRMDDLTKRITLALDIWKNVLKMIEDKDWQLDIVGGGSDKNKIMKFAKDHDIKNVNFFDAQEPKPFYERSLIFMMTSCSEGFANTIIEAQQFGCIPIAFNSYASINDIINNRENGFIIGEGDINGYENKLVELMKNPEILDKMIEPTIESTKRFDISIIGAQWLDVINNR